MDALALTRELVRFNTINPPGEEQACAMHLAGMLEKAGATIATYEFAPARTSLVATLGGAADMLPLCFTGHIDTVPLGAAPWAHDPFAGEIANGRVYGRGTTDMKAGVAAFVIAATRLASRLGRTPGLVLIITAGEETACEGARHLASISGAVGRAGAMVVAEPTGNAPCVGHKGAVWIKARTHGMTAHGSMPERGVNAIYKLARTVTRLESFRFDVPAHPVLGPPTVNVGVIRGGLNVNSVPDAASMEIDIRTIPEQKQSAVLEQIATLLGDEVECRMLIGADGVWTNADEPWIQQTFEIAERIAAAPRAVRAAPYFTDASTLTPAYDNAPTVILGPGETALAHQTDEYCVIERIEQAVAIYEDLIAHWCRL